MKHFRIIAIALLLLAIITLPVVAGGAGESAKDEDIVTLRFWGGVPPEAGPQASVDLFNEQYADKGIRVEYERFVNDDTGNLKLETNLLSGDGVDLYMTYTTDILAKRAEGNMALDLSELIERDGFDLTQYGGSLMESYYINGKPYCVPTKLDQYGIVLNKDMFDAAGIPIPTEWTFDEFREVAKKLTHGEGQDKVYGMFWNSQQDLTYILSYLVAQTNGGDPMYLSETESAFTDPVVLAAVELIYNMMNVDGSSPTHADSVTQKLSQEGVFLAGKSAMTIGPWMVRSIKDLDNYPHDFVTAFAPYPVYAEGQRNFTQGGYGDMLCINPKSEHIEEAWEFIKWYATEGMLPVVEGGRVPCFNTYDPAEVTAAFLKGGEELLDSETTMTVLINPADNYAAPSITNHSAEIKRVFTEEMETILLGDETPAEGMAKAKERADAILQQ
ncbi:MAG: sugar ABC transporter substrate-binding protein [Spirochaetes bacterium]|uniref:Sugar ABC transporter substrate-binding protein n=1 Tax=Candidatus Ornithospirochaeta stercoravium TaxID=2840897 RepID=A0A9D9IAT8_9SPIO|nr:sugar ABC transporter substrate-binding protein [Candidatus Ornithospirochaeta stercoravium]